MLATNNAHKVEEFSRIFSKLGLLLVTPRELGIRCEPKEDGDSFEQNALIKAREFTISAKSRRWRTTADSALTR